VQRPLHLQHGVPVRRREVHHAGCRRGRRRLPHPPTIAEVHREWLLAEHGEAAAEPGEHEAGVVRGWCGDVDRIGTDGAEDLVGVRREPHAGMAAPVVLEHGRPDVGRHGHHGVRIGGCDAQHLAARGR
jgi:hypothetical protein